MTGAMYAAIAGLRTHMQNLNVIGNNVANVNTYGYKSARSVFATSLYTTLSGGSDGTTVLGGANPSQIGYGATMSSIGIDMSTGNYAVTGRAMDWMLDGDGFFVMGDKETASRFTGEGTDQTILDGMSLTRVGNFWFGPDGYLSKENDGMCVYGFQVVGTNPDGKPIFSDQLVPIRLPCVETVTTGEGDNATQVTRVVYPSESEENGGHVTDPKTAGEGDAPAQDLARATFTGITIDKVTGIITGTCRETEELITIGCIAVGQVKSPDGVTNMGDNYYKAGAGSGGLSISMLGGAAKSIFDPYNARPDGATFFMNQSLRGDNADDDDTASDVQRLTSAGKTRVLSSGLEMSKTDLAQEISQMILTQRGYQANTRIITVTDSMLEELVNMKR